jgi:hypothetical protein
MKFIHKHFPKEKFMTSNNPNSNNPVPLPPLPDLMEPENEMSFLPQPEPHVPMPEFLEPKLPMPVLKPPFRIRTLRAGCYLVNYSPSLSIFTTYDGTIRVEANASGRTASGDLYQRPIIILPSFPVNPRPPIVPTKQKILLGPSPDPTKGIPILARNNYRYYLRITQVLEGITLGSSFTLGFEMWRFTKAGSAWSAGGTWSNEGAFTALMTWMTAPSGYPSTGNYLEGDVKNAAGKITGRLKMGWISNYLRKATMEIDRVAQSEAPLDNGAGINWRTIFDQVGWDVTAIDSNHNLAEPSGESWSDGECHNAMMTNRDQSNLDIEWRYHLLCIRRLDSTSRGIMYDAYGGDSNKIPREGAAMSSHWRFTNDPVFPENNPWGLCVNKRFGECPMPYFRTAVHELGHAMMLYHPGSSLGNYIMQVTPQIADNAVPPVQFPNNIVWAHSPDDQYCLRHLPDIIVRPGGVPFGVGHSPLSPPDSSQGMDGLVLHITPLMEAIPLGAPARINLELKNISSQVMAIPGSLSLKRGSTTGRVVDPFGTVRTFSPVVRYLDIEPCRLLEPDKIISQSLTLLRGANGALFPTSGMYKIMVDIRWDIGGVEAIVTGETELMVTGARDEAHASAAYKILSTPDALLTLVLGGDHLSEGIDAVQTALANPVLREHYAYIEAKRMAQRFGQRKANLKAAADLLSETVVMSADEIKKAAKLVHAEGASTPSGKNISKVLKSKAKTVKISDETKQLLDSL